MNSEPGHPRYGYVGIAPLLLVPLSLFARFSCSRLVALWVVGAWGALVAMTMSTPAFALYRVLPGGTWFREPWRIVVLTPVRESEAVTTISQTVSCGASSAFS